MSVEILRLNKLTPMQILAQAMSAVDDAGEIIVVTWKKDTTAQITYSAITPSQIAMASVELAEIARQHARAK
jgi:hypothetical protein